MAIDLEALPAIGERSAEDILELLAKPFRVEVIQTRRIGGRDCPYIAIGVVVNRLNKAAGIWTWRVVSVTTEVMPLTRKGELVDVPVVTVIGALEIPGLGVREGVGTAPSEGTEDSGKSAASDALKRAASLFGVPLSGS
jgi:hypothetical protein